MTCTSASAWRRQWRTLLSPEWEVTKLGTLYPLPWCTHWSHSWGFGKEWTIVFSYHSRSMPKGNKHFTVVILWPWGRMGLKRSTRISQGRPQTCNHQHPCPSVASFRAPTNNNGCLHNRLLAVTVRGLLCFGCPSSATWTSENQWVHLSHRHFLWL